MVFFYSALFPSCFFFGWAILTVQYYVSVAMNQLLNVVRWHLT